MPKQEHQPLPPDHPPPKAGPATELRLRYRSQRASVRLALATLVPLLVVGVVAAAFSVRAAGAAVSFDVLIGAESAFQKHAGAGGVVLAAVGYLIVPALASV